MTYAPAPLLAARRYLVEKLDAHPGVPHGPDLDPDEVGIVADGYGDSYHRGKVRLGTRPKYGYYSVDESPRDRAGLTNGASALDIGEFDQTVGGRRLTLRSLSVWLVEQCRAGTPDTRDIREIIYTADGRVVRRWDRLGVRTSGDSSHLTHTHISYFRDSEARDKTALYRRYVEGDDDMFSDNDRQDLRDVKHVLSRTYGDPDIGRNFGDDRITWDRKLEEIRAKVEAVSTPTVTDEQLDVLAERVAARLSALRFVAGSDPA